MIRAIVFDCFGVLLTDGLSPLVGPLYAKDPSARDRIRGLLELADSGLLTSDESAVKISTELGLTHEEYRQKMAKGEIKNQELLAYIESLRQHYKVGMLTNIPKGSLAYRFTSAELARYFDVALASGEIGSAKPEAKAYEIVAERLGVRPDECVFVDDRERYLDGAKAVGMSPILYENFPLLHGKLEALLADSK